ncbi:MAG: hypothetical protein IT372_42480 [Polyangiaceae bacterium]|nr:hypothetical protein [Polyangiaceae bacterium]
MPHIYPRIAWEDVGAGIRVVIQERGPVVEVTSGADAMGAIRWREVSTADPHEVRLRKIEGWKSIAVEAGLSPSQWKMVFKASRRQYYPLLVQYDAFDRPYVYEAVLRDWLVLNTRSARAFDAERGARGAKPAKRARPPASKRAA